MAVNIANVISGPAYLKIDDATIGHTQGGITVNVQGQSRVQTVDYYGSSAIGVIHTGDDVRVTAPIAEWAAAVLQSIYEPGLDSTGSSAGFVGVGRTAGYVYTGVDVKVVPVAASLASKYVQFYNATPVGQFELNFSTESDRIFNTEYVCMIDETKTDGNLIGAIFVGV